MKKNFSFLFALFLMFAGTMNVFADAYPFKITTDAENPELYAIKSGRGDAYWWTFNPADGMISLSSYVCDYAHFWYFMEVTEGETTYLQLFPYLGEGKAMSYQGTDNGPAKIYAKELGSDGWDNKWLLETTDGNAPYGLQTSGRENRLSNWGGVNNKMGMWNDTPKNDGGTAMYFEPVSENALTLAKLIKAADIFHLQEKYGLVQETSKFYCNVPQNNEGSLDNLLDNKYDTYFHSAWSASLAKPENHYLQAEVSEPVKDFAFYFKKRHNNNNNRPTDMTIMGSIDGVTYTEITNINSGFPTSADCIDYLSEVITAPEAYKYFRFVVNATNNNAKCGDYPFFTYSEFYILPNNSEVALKGKVREVANYMLAAEDGDLFFDQLMEVSAALADAYLAGDDATEEIADFESLVDLTTSNDLFTLVQDETSLAAGKRYIVLAAESAVALSAQHDGPTPYRLSANVKSAYGVVNAKLATAEGEELPYMIELVAAENGWMLKDVVYNKYLLWEEKRSLDLTDDMSKASVFEISINEAGEAVIKLEGKERTIRYGAEDDRFACYTIGQEAVKLYEDAAANEFLMAYVQLGELFNTCQSLWMIPAVNEKAMPVVEVADAINAADVFSCSAEEVTAATVAMSELVSYAWAMDAKYTEFRDVLWACYDLRDNSTASGKVATVFAAVISKYSAYQWRMPATTVADIDAYIAELNAAARNYALNATLNEDFVCDFIVNVESEWTGATLDKTLSGHLYNTAAKAFLGTTNKWGTQASFVENGLQWTVSAETECDLEWLFDDAEDVCAANVGGVSLIPYKYAGNNTAPVLFEDGEDNGIVQTAEGIFLPKTTSLFLPLNEEADLANYTLVFDIKLADAKNYTSLFQTNLTNSGNDDGDLFIHNNTMGVAGLGYSGTIEADTWHRIAVAVKDSVISTYIDGLHASSSSAANNRWVISKEGVFFFLDNDAESTDIELGGIQFWKETLSADRVKAMGAAFAETLTYTISGPLQHPKNVDQHYINGGFADGLAQTHTFTLVGNNLYTIQNNAGKYFAYKAGTTVVQFVDKLDENCYWQFVTDEEFRSKFASATAVEPANATFAIASANFCYNDTEVQQWTGEPSVGGDYANFVAYKQGVEICDMSYVVRDMPSGVYRLKVQGFYRQGGDAATAAAARQNGEEISPAKFYANDANVTVMNIIDQAGMNTTSTHGVAYGDYGKAPASNNDASVYFNLGLYEHELVFALDEGVDTIKIGLSKNGGVADDWVVMDNYRLEYLGTDRDILAVEELEASENAEVASRAYYTLGGMSVSTPVKGVNIVKTTYTNGKVEIQKILVK